MAPDEGPRPNIEQLRAKLRNQGTELDATERSWRDRQVFLQSRGYMLRPRYHPDWVPSWVKDPTLDHEDCEDYVEHPPRHNLMDATRMSDKSLVYIKRVPTDSDELKIALMLSSESLRENPRNHCVLILDHFEDEDDRTISYMVMPFLRLLDEPPFELVDQVIDFVDQILIGLVFIHEQGVAHRDCAYKNILMDANCLFPRSFHPVYMDELPDLSDNAPVLRREKAAVKYYYVDFGISSHIPPDSDDKLVVGQLGRDQDVPELSATVSYDPFKVDIFIIGNLLCTEFDKKYSNVRFLRPLIASMTAPDAQSRPTAAEALDIWQKIRKSILALHKAWRVCPYDEHWLKGFWLDWHCSFYLGPRLVRRAHSNTRALLRGLDRKAQK